MRWKPIVGAARTEPPPLDTPGNRLPHLDTMAMQFALAMIGHHQHTETIAIRAYNLAEQMQKVGADRRTKE